MKTIKIRKLGWLYLYRRRSKDIYKNVPNSFICNGQKLESPHVHEKSPTKTINGCVYIQWSPNKNKNKVLQCSNTYEHEQAITCISASNIGEPHRNKCVDCMIPFLWGSGRSKTTYSVIIRVRIMVSLEGAAVGGTRPHPGQQDMFFIWMWMLGCWVCIFILKSIKLYTLNVYILPCV